MAGTWAVILSGTVVNIVLAYDTDVKDPTYIWVDISAYNPMPGIGLTTTDNINFTAPEGSS
jgi:hypothetical protein